jgi:hypothetical protein
MRRAGDVIIHNHFGARDDAREIDRRTARSARSGLIRAALLAAR